VLRGRNGLHAPFPSVAAMFSITRRSSASRVAPVLRPVGAPACSGVATGFRASVGRLGVIASHDCKPFRACAPSAYERRGWDSNPRGGLTRPRDFQSQRDHDGAYRAGAVFVRESGTVTTQATALVTLCVGPLSAVGLQFGLQ
jgi:hypothetical protein